MYCPSASDWRWFAGVFDGEGHISMVERSNGRLARRLAITNANLPLLVEIAKRFGGKIHVHRPVRHYKTSFQWYCYGPTLRRLLKAIVRYLVGKQDEARLCLAFDGARPIRKGQHLTATDRTRYEKLLEQVDQLRRRTWTAADVPAQFRSKQ